MSFEFVKTYNAEWAEACEWALNHLYRDNPSCVGKVRAIAQDVVNKVIKNATLPEPRNPHGPFRNIYEQADVKTALGSAYDHVEKINKSGRDNHKLKSPNDEAKESLKSLFNLLLWYLEKYENLDKTLISPLILSDSPEESEMNKNINRSLTRNLANTRTNGPALQKRYTTRQDDSTIQEQIMAFLHAAAPIKKAEAIAVLSEKLNLPRIEENIHILITDNILKQANDTLLVHRANAESKEICTEAYNQHLPEIISLLEQLP
ncbi:MAG: hypothetical protein ACK5UY_08285 [Holosporales bacterium]